MIKSDVLRPDTKRRHIIEKKKQFAAAAYKQQDYPHRLNFYDVPPTAEISLEDFERWAIDRLRSEYAVTDQRQGMAYVISSRGNRSMLFSQQIPPGNSYAPRATS
jgi:hypothetical protein